MSITLQCPGCGKKLKTKDELAGKRVKCPGCGHLTLAPAAGNVPPPPGQIVAKADPQPRKIHSSPPTARLMSPRMWVWFSSGLFDVLLLTEDTLACSPLNFDDAVLAKIRAEFKTGHVSLTSLGEDASVIPLNAITSLKKTVSRDIVNGSTLRTIEIQHDAAPIKGPLTVCTESAEQGEEFFGAITQALGPGWHCRTSAERHPGWLHAVLAGILLTVLLVGLAAIAYGNASAFANMPWPIGLAGFVVLLPLAGLFYHLELYGLCTLSLILLASLVGAIAGEIGVLVVGAALVVLLWLWLLFVTVQRTSYVTRESSRA